MILDALNFVKGSVAAKDLVPELTHLEIKDSRITGFNGTLSLSTPIDIPFDAIPNAVALIKSIMTCTDEVNLSLTKAGKLKLVSGKFVSFIDCLADWNTSAIPEHKEKPITTGASLLPALRELRPFISVDASRPWSRGILLRNGSAFATNNICLVQKHIGSVCPFETVIPAIVVNELLRINEEPERISFDGNTLIFYYANKRWLRAAVLDPTWPDIDSVLTAYVKKGTELPELFFETLKQLQPFLDESRSAYFAPGQVSSSPHEEKGVTFELAVAEDMRFNAEQLLLLEKTANKIDFSSYPEPCGFVGNKLRGVIIGMVHEV